MLMENTKKANIYMALAFVIAIPAEAQDCTNWNTGNFFYKAKKSEVISCISQGADVTARGEGNQTPLHIAAGLTPNSDVVTGLLEAGADASARDENGLTPVHYASGLNPNPDVVSALLEAGADVSARDKSNQTPLHHAAGYNPNPNLATVLPAWSSIFAPDYPAGYNSNLDVVKTC